ncbi:MAG: PLP-dependent aminotransferase family protein [Lachnospiraceae bacterium]|nr:PLP-dependent aminotransferase family protein [Lachnospiraceae bacterium]
MYELTILLDENNKIPLYEQIYEHIRDEIRQGKIAAGTKVPSTRLLAEHLGVSRSTTQLAYDQLTAEGYLESRPCKGYFAAGVEGLCEIRTKEAVRPVETQEESPYRYDFSPSGIDPDGFPSSIWKKLTREVLVGENDTLFAHGDSQGELGLREAVCDYLYSARGVHCRAEQILIGAGSEYLLMLLSQMIDGKPVIAMENPTYRQAYRVFRGLEHRVMPVPMDEHGIEIQRLNASGASLVYVMPSHQFPTGKIMPLKRRMELLAWAKERSGRYIIEDDYDSEFRYRGKPIPALQGYDRGDHVIYIGTFSRSIAPGIRVSFLVLPESLLARYREKCKFYATTVSRIDQEILTRFIRGGYYERHLNRMKGVYRAKHDLLMELLKPFQKRFVIRGENAGIHVLLEEKTVKRSGGFAEEDQLIRQAAEKGVKVYSLQNYYVSGRTERSTILLGFARMSGEEIREAVKLLAEAWEIELENK